jgi:uncharacterized membrane protein
VTRLANARIERAIRTAEAGTTGRIAVRIVPDEKLDAFARAREEFERAGMHRHGPRNVALILVAPRAHRYAVLGDKALHERVGDAFWKQLVEEMGPSFRRGDDAGAILHAIDRIGEELRTHFAVSA